MKKMMAFIVCILIIYSVYKDITIGTIPPSTPKLYSSYKVTHTNNYTLIKIEQGETVLSILDKQLQPQTNISFEEMKKDFTELNDGIDPTQIKHGQVYKFPLYN